MSSIGIHSGISNANAGYSAVNSSQPGGLDDSDRELLKTIYAGAVKAGDKTGYGRGYMGLVRTKEGISSVKFMTHWYDRGLLTDSKLMKGVAATGRGDAAFSASESLELALIELAKKTGVESAVRQLIADYKKHADYNDSKNGGKSLLSRKVVYLAANAINDGAKSKGVGVNVQDVETVSSKGHKTTVANKSGFFESDKQVYGKTVIADETQAGRDQLLYDFCNGTKKNAVSIAKAQQGLFKKAVSLFHESAEDKENQITHLYGLTEKQIAESCKKWMGEAIGAVRGNGAKNCSEAFRQEIIKGVEALYNAKMLELRGVGRGKGILPKENIGMIDRAVEDLLKCVLSEAKNEKKTEGEKRLDKDKWIQTLFEKKTANNEQTKPVLSIKNKTTKNPGTQTKKPTVPANNKQKANKNPPNNSTVPANYQQEMMEVQLAKKLNLSDYLKNREHILLEVIADTTGLLGKVSTADLIDVLIDIQLKHGEEQIAVETMKKEFEDLYPKAVQGNPVKLSDESAKKLCDLLNNNNVEAYDENLELAKILNLLDNGNSNSDYQVVEPDKKSGGWKVGSYVVKQGVRGVDLQNPTDDKLMMQGNGNGCWLVSLINALKMTPTGRTYLAGLFPAGMKTANLIGADGKKVSVKFTGKGVEDTVKNHVLNMTAKDKDKYELGKFYKAEKGAKALGLVNDVATFDSYRGVMQSVVTDLQKEMYVAEIITAALQKGDAVVINAGKHYMSIVDVRDDGTLLLADSMSGKMKSVPLSSLFGAGKEAPQIEFFSQPPSPNEISTAQKYVSQHVNYESAKKKMGDLEDIKQKLEDKETGKGWFGRKFQAFKDSLGNTYDGWQNVATLTSAQESSEKVGDANNMFRIYLQKFPK